MRAYVDRVLCVGSRTCETICPEIFKLVDGKSTVKTNPIPAGEEYNFREALMRCPVGAISAG